MRHLNTRIVLAVAGAVSLAAVALANPKFDKDGRLLLPADRDRWITVGTTYALSYEGDGSTSFNTVRMDPKSYDRYVKTGRYPVGTMLDLEVRQPMTEVAPAKGGKTQGKVIGRSLHVKDEKAGPGTWTFYSYSDDSSSGRPIPRSQACYSCHQEHATDDTVFSQFYPSMTEARDKARAAIAGKKGHSD
jgi:hypothetical protein